MAAPRRRPPTGLSARRSTSGTGSSTPQRCTGTRNRSARRSPTAASRTTSSSSLPSCRPETPGEKERTIEASLGALGLDHVDLWLIHWPPAARALVPTWEAVLAAHDAGLAASVGVSNYSVDQIDRLIDATDEAPAVNQVPWAPSLFDPEFLAASRDRDVVVEGYSPFKNTNLRDRELAAIAENHGVSPAQVVVRWHVQHEVVVIPKSASPDRVAENFDVFGFELSAEEMGTLDR